ncbi:hypothetical protein PBI_JACE_46 [Gordonia phage Jace]|uniref:Uncharacterized protein n=1 Tax=Gordonia phage Jace TaxID=2182360 RepID=A0A2U8UJN4_9CAUD|nr:hypothetical protein HOT28_gp46 [Gordonia phage Jace]AWN03666.1 hypothetical protein PBI_JACE_46 [Gordonia phage Jace]
MTTALLLDETALEDEAHQRNTQTAADFPPGTVVHLTGSPRRWVVDTRRPDGTLLLINDGRTRQLDAHALWRIDPICQETA